MSYTRNDQITELWAVIDKKGNIQQTRGGSSTTPRLMVYTSLKKAEAALNSCWIKQVIKRSEVDVIKVYDCIKKSK